MSDTIRWVRITSVPAGEAPPWVRKAWIGVELPDTGETLHCGRHGVVTGKKVRSNQDDFIVSSATAIGALRAKDHMAAQWFEQHAPVGGWGKFFFNRSEVTVIPSPSSHPPSMDIQDLNP
jgi:hypothetical protein